MLEECKHLQLARSCNLCEAAKSIQEGFMEGYSRGFDNANFSEPKYGLAEKEFESSDAKINSDAV